VPRAVTSMLDIGRRQQVALPRPGCSASVEPEVRGEDVVRVVMPTTFPH